MDVRYYSAEKKEDYYINHRIAQYVLVDMDTHLVLGVVATEKIAENIIKGLKMLREVEKYNEGN